MARDTKNICNGVETIPNPKKTREIKKLEKKIELVEIRNNNYKEKRNNLVDNSEIKRYDKQIANWNEIIKKYKEKMKDIGEINPVKIRKTEPDNFVR